MIFARQKSSLIKKNLKDIKKQAQLRAEADRQGCLSITDAFHPSIFCVLNFLLFLLINFVSAL